LVKKLIGFRVDEGKFEEFHALAEHSGYSIQRILADFVEACLTARSVEVAPIPEKKGGRLRANILRLRETIQELRGCIEQKNFDSADDLFRDLLDEMKLVNDSGLLEDAELVADTYLKWINKHRLDAGGYKPERF
jgi:hypothetical protein